MTNAIDVDDDLDLNPEDEAPVVLTREQELSRMTLRELQLICKDPAYGLSAQGRTSELIERIVAFESGEPLGADAIDLKPGIAPTPVAPAVTAPPSLTTPPSAPPTTTPRTSAGATASVPADPAPAGPTVRAAKQRTGFFETTNTFRAEFPLGPRATIDDPTHMQFIEETHNAARDAGYRPKGAPYAGHRVGFSVIRTDAGAMRSVIYEVFARPQED